MTLLNFPPTNGQPTDGSFTYTANGVIYSWDGEKWTANSEQGLDGNYVNKDGDTMTGDLTVPNLISEGDVTAGGDITADGNISGANGIFEGDVQTTSLNGGPLAGMRNQLINGDMRICQRTRGPVTGKHLFAADRWKSIGSNVTMNNLAVTTLPGFDWYLRVEASSGNSAVAQYIELDKPGSNAAPGVFALNSVWTLSYWTQQTFNEVSVRFTDGGTADGNQQSCTVGARQDVKTVGSWTLASHQVTIDTSPVNSNTALRVAFVHSAPMFITGVQFEPGSQPTPFEMRPIGTELALCQRYYQDLQVRRINSETNWYTLPIKMRVRPTTSTDIGANIYDDSFGVIAGAAGRINAQFDAEL